MVLAAAGAAVAPIIIHLILRTKPRKITFPALRFVKKTHQANLSKLRLKHLLLLLLRMSAIVAIAMLLARAEIPSWESTAAARRPVAAAIVVDDSGSMGYHGPRQTRLSRAKSMGAELIQSFPSGSRIAIITSSAPTAGSGFHSDPRLAIQALSAVEGTFSHAGLAPALARASEVVGDVELPRKAVYVLTDMTAQSWRDVTPVSGAEEVEFVVLRCGGSEQANRSIGALELSSSSVSKGLDVTVDTVITSVRLGGEVKVQANLGERAVDQRMVKMPTDGSASVSLKVTPKSGGIIHWQVSLPSDFLKMDDVRYFTLRVGPMPNLLIVREGTTVGRGDETSRLMANAIAPPGGQEWIRRKTITTRNLDDRKLADYRLVLLVDVAQMTETQWRRMEQYVRGGGKLWIVAGELMSLTSYNSSPAQRIMPATLKPLEDLPQPMAWRVVDEAHPMLEPFAGRKNPPLSLLSCRRRFAMDDRAVAPGAGVVVRYADGTPVILTRTVGDGEVVLWNFSPRREFSGDLAGKIQFPILALHTAKLLTRQVGDTTLYTYGRNVTFPLPKEMRNPKVLVLRPGRKLPEKAQADVVRRTVSLRVDRCGPWELSFTEGSLTSRFGFSVNSAPAESDLTPIKPQKVMTLLPEGRGIIAADVADLAGRAGTVPQALDLAPLLLIGLLVLLTGELFFANRFYRQPAGQIAASISKRSLSRVSRLFRSVRIARLWFILL